MTQFRKFLAATLIFIALACLMMAKPLPVTNITGKVSARSIEGIILQGNVLKTKPGYKFVRRSDGTAVVARISGGGGGLGESGDFLGCSCTAKPHYACRIVLDDSVFSCDQGNCTGTCKPIISQLGQLRVIY